MPRVLEPCLIYLSAIPCNQEVYDVAKKEIRDLCLRLLTLSNSSIVTSDDCKQVVSLQFAMFPFFKFDAAKH